MNSEIIDFDENNFPSSKCHEKDYVIEELNKKIRFISFDYEKKIKELENQLLLSTRGSSESRNSVNKDMTQSDLMDVIKELEENLTKNESELIQIKEVESSLRSKVYQLEVENLTIKKNSDRISKLAKNNISMKNMMSLKNLPNINESQDMGNIRNEYERLKQNLQKLEEDYDDLKARKDEELNEKEQTIIDYKQKISEIDIYYQTQLNSCLEEIQSLQDSRRKNLGSINPEVERLKNELLLAQEALSREEIICEEKINELQTIHQNQIAEYAGKLFFLEKDFNERTTLKIKQQLERSSINEASLLDEIKKNEDKMETLEKENKELKKKTVYYEKKIELVEKEATRKIEEIEKKNETKEEIKKLEHKFERSSNEMKAQLLNEIREKDEHISNIEQTRVTNMKKLLHIEGENKRLQDSFSRLQEKCQILEKTNNENEEKYNKLIENYEEKIFDLEQTLQQERQNMDQLLRNTQGRKVNKGNINIQRLIDDNMIGNSPMSNASGMQASMLLNPLSNDLQGLLGDEMEPRDLFSKRMSGSIISYGIGITDTFAFESKHKISDKDKDDMNLNPDLLSIEKISRSPSNFGMENRLKELESLLKEKEIEIKELKSELNALKENYEGIQEKLLKEFEKNKNLELNKIKEGQENRKRTMNSFHRPHTPENNEIDKYIKEKKQIEKKLQELQREYNDEKEFLENEIKKAEESINEGKNKFMVALNERDYFENLYRNLVEELKKQKITVEDSKVVKSKLSKFMMCTCK